MEYFKMVALRAYLAAAMGDSLQSNISGATNKVSATGHLASGITQVLGDKIQSRINQTIGGQVASAINQSSDAQTNNNTSGQLFDNNSLSGGNASTSDSRADEIRAFRDG